MVTHPPATAPLSFHSLRALLTALLLSFAFFLAPGNTRAADDTINGNLLIEAKGEVEVYHNGRKIVLRDKADSRQHYRVKVPERAFKAGDTIVLSIRSPYVYRAVAVAINLVNKGGQIPIKKANWRFLGEGTDATKITAAEIEASQDIPAVGNPDPNGDAEREKLGILPEAKGGSEWVKTAKQLNQSYCIGFVLTPELIKAPVEVGDEPVNQKDLICPKCGGFDIATIRYRPPEFLGPGFVDYFDRDPCRIVRQDRVATDQDPGLHCRGCSYEWGETIWAPIFRRRTLRSKAQAGGRLVAYVYDDGFTRCPHCKRVFSTRDQPGEVHNYCGGSLTFLPKHPRV